ncbi:MAG: helix-turn-helix domain-containing protein [Planctomycetaceae bacterium]|nr:helix-turn-helix domain-containing protein [Planctomycetaceae bacterium]
MQKLISPRQAARAIGVSESTLKRWCDQGLIRTTKTAGGHRRMEVEAVVQFLRESDHEVVEPELLGLPAGVGASLTLDSSVSESLLEALIAGEDVLSRKLVFDLLLSGLPITALCDDLLTPVFHRIGEKWSCGDVAIYQERRACEVCLRILHELRRTFHRVAADAPLAVGATPEGDIYSLPVCMAEQVLRSFGWNATLLGSGLPAETLELAVSETRPQLVWISVSHIEDERRFVDGVNRVFATADRIGSPLIIGGRALTPQLRKRIQFSAHGETFRDLERFARSLHRTDLSPTPPADQLHDELPQ